MPCKGKEGAVHGDVIAGPANEIATDLILGLLKPVDVSVTPAVVYVTSAAVVVALMSLQ